MHALIKPFEEYTLIEQSSSLKILQLNIHSLTLKALLNMPLGSLTSYYNYGFCLVYVAEILDIFHYLATKEG